MTQLYSGSDPSSLHKNPALVKAQICNMCVFKTCAMPIKHSYMLGSDNDVNEITICNVYIMDTLCKLKRHNMYFS